MEKKWSLLARTALVLLIVALACSFATSAYVYRCGMIVVNVHEKHPGGTSVYLVVPGVLAQMSAHFIPRSRLHGAGREIEHWLPVILATVDTLSDCEDGTLVEVESAKEKVRIAKLGRSLVIDADTEDETVHLRIPLGTIGAIAGRLASPAGATITG